MANGIWACHSPWVINFILFIEEEAWRRSEHQPCSWLSTFLEEELVGCCPVWVASTALQLPHFQSESTVQGREKKDSKLPPHICLKDWFISDLNFVQIVPHHRHITVFEISESFSKGQHTSLLSFHLGCPYPCTHAHVVQNHYVLIGTDNTVVVAYINSQGMSDHTCYTN